MSPAARVFSWNSPERRLTRLLGRVASKSAGKPFEVSIAEVALAMRTDEKEAREFLENEELVGIARREVARSVYSVVLSFNGESLEVRAL